MECFVFIVFVSLPCPTGVTEGDVPWPDVGSADTYGFGLHATMSASEKLRRLRTAQRRWHPDKFMQKFGSRLLPSDREKVRYLSQLHATRALRWCEWCLIGL